ncbi:sensor histidine kinase [Kitasatospora sp. NPDC050543]|uniref:sensor histidine kinase n=1 Tax=Kitasatospora sp. NPDC050543 TaxID=3364054 RepID=UPI0037A05895
MHATPPLPLLKRVSPGVWTALTWCAVTLYSFLVMVRLPGEGSGFNHQLLPFRLGLLSPQWVFLAPAFATTAAGCVLLRRLALPALALLLSGAVCGAMALNSSEINFLQFLPIDVALCFVATTRPRRPSILALVMALLVLTSYATTRLVIGFQIGTSTELAVALTAVVAWFIGHSSRQSREHARQLGTQAAAQAVTTERLRIARELHDMVAHSIGIVALQAGAASRVFDTQPARARSALGEVEAASRETLSGLRRMLGALRQDELGQHPDADALQPMPGLADLERLAATTTAAGVRVDVCWHGERRPLPPEIDLSAFRIIQESVTNVVRHAGTGSCRVSIDCRDEELAIEVLDGGQGRSGGTGAGAGYGLVGMRERVTLLHGDFCAEPRPEGGFRVAARLPVPTGVR